MFSAWHNALQNLDVNCTPRSEMMLSGTPCNLTISLMKAEAVSVAEGVPYKGTKWAILVRRSTTTNKVVKSSDGGSSTMKSMEIMLHGFSGTGSGSSRPQVLALSVLFRRHVTQELTYLLQSCIKSGHQNVREISSAVLRIPKWPANGWS